ncbi:MAG: GntR family transcriptional regulator [Phycisphaerae bacterium]|nr:GntR family transcriptional regulator [Phycisphaerae bacterium]
MVEMAIDSSAEQAYRAVLNLIHAGDISFNDIISERRLADRLAVGRLAVRTALKRLEAEGVVLSRPGVGTQLCRIDAQEMWGWLQWRVAVECQAARLACEFMTPDQAKRLIEAGRVLDEAVRRGEPGTSRTDEGFHLLVAECSGCGRLRHELGRLDIYRLKLSRCEAVEAAAKTPPEPPPDHQAVAQAVASGDVAAAERTMRAHLECSGTMYGFVTWLRAKYGKGATS